MIDLVPACAIPMMAVLIWSLHERKRSEDVETIEEPIQPHPYVRNAGGHHND